ncbi:putative glutathione transferase [Helianthus anomalus]
MEVESQKLEPAAMKLIWELCMKPLLFGQNSDDAVVSVEKKKLESVLDVYEARLSESKYLGGDSFSLADMHTVPTIKFLMDTQMKQVFDARPCVSAWVADIMSRPACVKGHWVSVVRLLGVGLILGAFRCGDGPEHPPPPPRSSPSGLTSLSNTHNYTYICIYKGAHPQTLGSSTPHSLLVKVLSLYLYVYRISN